MIFENRRGKRDSFHRIAELMLFLLDVCFNLNQLRMPTLIFFIRTSQNSFKILVYS